MKTILVRFLAICFLSVGLLRAALPPASPFTDKERAQGFVDSAVIAKPRAAYRATIDAAEVRLGLAVRQKFKQIDQLRVLSVPAGESVKHALRRLRATGLYEYVEPDRILRARLAPDDPSFGSGAQWSLNNTVQSGTDISALAAWNIRHDAASVIVGVLDSGARLTHIDLAANLWNSTDTGHIGTHGISAVSGRIGNPIDDYTPNDFEVGHGTHISGIIGAVGNNGTGIAGIAWKTQLMELRFLHGTDGEGVTSDSIACIDFAIAHGAAILNASYGSDTFSQSEFDAIARARAAGIIFVAAAGNGDSNNVGFDTDSGDDYPAGYALDNIVTVAASNRSDEITSYSNYGSGTVDLAAPGDAIYSTLNTSDASYGVKSGTSMATPHVTGALALLKAQFPGDSYRQLINRLLRATTKLSTYNGKVQSGGRLNLAAALASTDNRPFNDDFSTRATLSGPTVVVRSNNSGATRETTGGEPAHAGFSTATTSLWWSWTAPDTTQVVFDTAGSAYDTVLAIYQGASLSALTPVAANDDTTVGATTSRLLLNVTAGATYQIAVAGKGGASGFTALRIGEIPANDNFFNATAVSGIDVRATGTTRNASSESGEPNPTNQAAGHSVWYRWTAPVAGHFSLAAFATTSDTITAVYTGDSVAGLTLIGSNDDNASLTNTDSLTPFDAIAGTTYYFQIDHTISSGDGGDFILTLTDSLWEFPALDEVTSSPAVGADGTIYFGAGSTANGFDTRVYAVNPDGTQKWSYATSTSASGIIDASPALGADGTVYIESDDQNLYALDGTTGALKWKFAASSPLSSAPAIALDGTVYFRDDTTLYALTAAGTQKWSFPLNASAAGGTYASPVIATDGTIYIGTTGGAFYALTDQGASATQKWLFTAATTDTDSADIYTSAAIAADGTIYFGTLNGRFYALTPSGSQKWSWFIGDATQSITSSPALGADGTIYFAAYDHALHALDPVTGNEKWSCALGDETRASSPAVAANGTIYVGCLDSLVYAVSPTGSIVRTFPTAQPVRSSPVIAGNRLYFGSADAKLHAFDIAQSAALSAWPMYRQNPAHTARSAPTTPTVTLQPWPRIEIGAGYAFTLSVAADDAIAFQWYRDGAPLASATGSSYTVFAATATDAGSYTVVVTGTGASVTSTPAIVSVEPPRLSRIANLSARADVGTGDNILIAGFVLNGTPDKSIFVRAVGPALTHVGVSAGDVLADPQLMLFDVSDPPSLIATNDNWNNDPAITAAETTLGATPAFDIDSKDAALITVPLSHAHTLQVSGIGNTTGIALAELYDTDISTGARLVNISARAHVGSGAQVLIAGFVISGNTPIHVLIRAVGPTLTSVNVLNPLADPQLTLYRYNPVTGQSIAIAFNDNWGNDPAITDAGSAGGAYPQLPPNSKDAALLLSLQPGIYTAQVSGVAGATGISLVEVYEVP